MNHWVKGAIVAGSGFAFSLVCSIILDSVRLGVSVKEWVEWMRILVPACTALAGLGEGVAASVEAELERARRR